MTNNQFFIGIVVIVFCFFGFGYLYTNAGQQAKDIKACESAGANWKYSSVTNVVTCTPRPPQCKEYFKDE